VAIRDSGLEINSDKSKYMVMCRDQNAGRFRYIKIDISSFEKQKDFKYLETNLTDQNSFSNKLREDLKQGMLAIIRCRFILFQACY